MKPIHPIFRVCMALCLLLVSCGNAVDVTPDAPTPLSSTAESVETSELPQDAEPEPVEADDSEPAAAAVAEDLVVTADDADESENLPEQAASEQGASDEAASSNAVTESAVDVESDAGGEVETEATDVPDDEVVVANSAENTASSTITTQPAFTPLYGDGSAASQPNGTFEETVEQSLQVEPLLAALDASLDQTQFDTAKLAAALNYDAEQIVPFVRDQIAFEPYQGILRGPFGTLVSRAGNSVDQVLLLRQLLEDAGYETRIAQAELSEAQAQQLVTQALVRVDIPDVGATDAANAAQTRLREALGLTNLPATDGTISAETTPDFEFLVSALDSADVALGDQQIIDIIADAQQYYWLQFRLSPFDAWTDTHPAFGMAQAPEVEPLTTYLSELPSNLNHRVELAVYIESKLGDELDVRQIVRTVGASSAELFGRTITFANQPNNIDPIATDDIVDVLSATSIFMPVINGELAGDAFDLSGRAFGLDLLALDTVGALPLFQTVADATDTASALIGSLGSEDADPDTAGNLDLTAQWVEYTQISPDGERTTTRRYMMDRIGEANREARTPEIIDGLDKVDAAQQLLTNNTLAVLPGRYTPTYAAHRQLDRLQKEMRILEYVNANPALEAWPDALLQDLDPTFDVTAALLMDYVVPDEVVAFRPKPTLVVYQEGLLAGRSQATGFERVDVISNERYVLRADGDGVTTDPAMALHIGIMETAVEPLMIQPMVDGTLRQANTLETFRVADSSGSPFTLLLPDSAELVETLNQSDETKRDIMRDLQAGYAVLVPETATHADGSTSWWRVDLETGETLGISTGGYGNTFTEYFISLKIGAAFFIAGQASCTQGGGSVGCCLAQNGAGFALGLGLGLGIGAVVAAEMAFAISFLSLDLTLNTALLFAPSLCGP